MWPSSPIQIREEEHGHDDIDTQSVHGLTYRKRGNTNIPNGSTDTVVIKEVDKVNMSSIFIIFLLEIFM